MAIYLQKKRGWSAGTLQMIADGFIVCGALAIVDPLRVGPVDPRRARAQHGAGDQPPPRALLRAVAQSEISRLMLSGP